MPDVREYSLAALHYRPARCVIFRVLTSTQYSVCTATVIWLSMEKVVLDQLRNGSACPIGDLSRCAVDTVTQWREDWSSASLVNHTTVTDPAIRQPSFDLPRHTWSLINRFRTGQGACRAKLHKWGLAQSPSFDCDQQQTMIRIVHTFPLTKFEGGLNLLHAADDDAVIWLESTATAALAK